jgi:predicted tellurium resistance membrane protein TerC
VPAEHQQRVLTFGILMALVMRAIFIALGAVLIKSFSFMFAIFGLLLLATAIRLFRHRDQDPDVEDNAIVRLTRRVIPVTESYDDDRMITRVGGRRVATPLFIVLIAIGSSDLLLALDSIPAVFGVTEEAFIVFAANAFALLGLRALYDSIPEVETSTSLLVIVVVLAVTGRRVARRSHTAAYVCRRSCACISPMMRSARARTSLSSMARVAAMSASPTRANSMPMIGRSSASTPAEAASMSSGSSDGIRDSPAATAPIAVSRSSTGSFFDTIASAWASVAGTANASSP